MAPLRGESYLHSWLGGVDGRGTRASSPASNSLWADAGSLAPEPVLPMAPDKPDDSENDDRSNHGVEFVEVLAQFAPVLTQLHPEPRQTEAPRPGTEEGVDVEAPSGHAGDTCGQRDEGADY